MTIRSLQQLATEALEIQSACNGTGVALSMHKAMCELFAHARTLGKGTDWVNTHPVTCLYLDKLVALAKCDWPVHMSNYHRCQALADGRNPDGVVADMADALTKEDSC